MVPCYNEEEVLTETARQLYALLSRLIDARQIGAGSRVYFVDDGSRDRTWEIIEDIRSRHSCFGGIELSRNGGHQNALLTGLLAAPGDVLVSIDADLQDDVAAIVRMMAEVAKGVDIVYGVRSARATDTAMKRWTAHLWRPDALPRHHRRIHREDLPGNEAEVTSAYRDLGASTVWGSRSADDAPGHDGIT